jgi:hypothetical protein
MPAACSLPRSSSLKRPKRRAAGNHGAAQRASCGAAPIPRAQSPWRGPPCSPNPRESRKRRHHPHTYPPTLRYCSSGGLRRGRFCVPCGMCHAHRKQSRALTQNRLSSSSLSSPGSGGGGSLAGGSAPPDMSRRMRLPTPAPWAVGTPGERRHLTCCTRSVRGALPDACIVSALRIARQYMLSLPLARGPSERRGCSRTRPLSPCLHTSHFLALQLWN